MYLVRLLQRSSSRSTTRISLTRHFTTLNRPNVSVVPSASVSSSVAAAPSSSLSLIQSSAIPSSAAVIPSSTSTTASFSSSSSSSSSVWSRAPSFLLSSYDPSSYSSPPPEPQYSLPDDDDSTSSDTYELFYFALRGRAEQIRFCLIEGNLPYKDRLLTQWQLRKLKATGSPISNINFLDAQRNSPLPFGGLPLLKKGREIFLGQTPAIIQYISEVGEGLLPKKDKWGPVERARAQMLVAGTEDLFQTYWPIKLDQNKYLYHSGSFPLTPGTNANYIAAPSNYLPDPFQQYSVPRNFRRNDLPRWLTYFEILLEKNQTIYSPNSLYFLTSEFTYIDLIIFAHLQACVSIEPQCLNSFTRLKKHYQLMEQRPKLKKYLETRPDSGL